MSVVSHEAGATRLRKSRLSLAVNRPNLIFWLCFLSLNGLLFAPLYLFNLDSSSFLPLHGAAGQPASAIVQQLALWRNNQDIFRLSLEVAVLAGLWANGPWLWRGRRAGAYRALFFAVYVLAFCYAVYESVSLNLYQVDPVFYGQYRLAIEGIKFVVDHLQWPWTVYAGGAAAAAALLALALLLTFGLIGRAPQRLSRGTRLAAAALAGWALLAPLAFGVPLASPRAAVNSLAAKLQQNVAESLALRDRIAAFDSQAPERVYDYSRYPLLHKPDVYLIFVESYGSVLYKRPDWRASYERLLGELEQELAGGGWHMATALSESPTWGGGSWMAYTSALFGLRIDTHAQYLALLDQYQDAAYPDLGRYLQSQGYYSLRIDSIATELRASEWEKYRRFYGLDELRQFGGLDYQGPRYGWGPAPPDQYVLWYAETEIAQTIEQPLFMFYITQNSHYPWTPQPRLATDWRTLNRPADDPAAPLPDQIPHEARRRNYFRAIDYQLRFLTDFILRTGRDDAIYVLIGDHQPQQVSRRNDSFDTPLHIISRDADLIRSFRAVGFSDGLAVDEIAPTLRHEGLYSLFVRTLLANYGQGGRVLPAYLPNGIVLDERTIDDEPKETRPWIEPVPRN